MVPVGHGRRIAAAYGPGVESYFVPGADHVAAYSANPGLYTERLLAFLERGSGSAVGDGYHHRGTEDTERDGRGMRGTCRYSLGNVGKGVPSEPGR